MELREAIGNRRSMRYLDPDRPVEIEKIQSMLEAARMDDQVCDAERTRIAALLSRHFQLDADAVASLVVRAEAEMPRAAAEHHRGQLSFVVFDREVDVARAMAFDVRQLAFDPQIRERALEFELDMASNVADRVDGSFSVAIRWRPRHSSTNLLR